MSDSKEIAVKEGSFLSILDKAVSGNMPADTIHKLIDAQERIMAKQAEINFNSAMARLQPKLPVIERKSKAHNSMYAKYEDIDAKVRPIYTAEGFSVSFTSKKGSDGVTYYGTLSHVDGHSRTAEIELPPDKSGSKNDIQAKGSTISYAKRYLLTMLLNIVTADEDDDGDSADPISQGQVDEIRALVEDTSSDIKKFCEYMNVKSIAGIQQKDFKKAVSALQKKRK